MEKLTDTNKRKILDIAGLRAERNLIAGAWNLKTAQVFLRRVVRQPEEHLYLINKN